jgi:hypothetical protein
MYPVRISQSCRPFSVSLIYPTLSATSSQALHSVVDLGLQYNLPPFPMIPGRNTPIFFIPIIFKSSSTSSFHLLHALPLFLVPSIVAAAICYGILWFCILSTCPYHLILEDFINFNFNFKFNFNKFILQSLQLIFLHSTLKWITTVFL